MEDLNQWLCHYYSIIIINLHWVPFKILKLEIPKYNILKSKSKNQNSEKSLSRIYNIPKNNIPTQLLQFIYKLLLLCPIEYIFSIFIIQKE